MLIINTKTKLQQNLENIEAPLSRIDTRTKANAEDLNQSLNAFWSLPDKELEEVLNYHGVEKVQAIFAAHEKYARSFNELLEDRGLGSIALVGAKRELSIDEKGFISVIPLKQEIVTDPETNKELIVIDEQVTEAVVSIE